MTKSIHVFISSTWLDLQLEREAVEKELHRMQDTKFIGMEYFGSRAETPKEVSLAEVDRSDIYVGIFGYRYGSGITEAEYRRAQERRIPCFIYIKEDAADSASHNDATDDARLKSLKDELKKKHTVSFFNNPDQLAGQVGADLHRHLSNTTKNKEETLGKSDLIFKHLEQAMLELQSARDLFNSRIVPSQTHITKTYIKTEKATNLIITAISLMDNIQPINQSEMMSLRVLLDDQEDGVLSQLNIIGEELMNLAAREKRKENGKIVHKIRKNFILAENILKGLVLS